MVQINTDIKVIGSCIPCGKDFIYAIMEPEYSNDKCFQHIIKRHAAFVFKEPLNLIHNGTIFFIQEKYIKESFNLLDKSYEMWGWGDFVFRIYYIEKSLAEFIEDLINKDDGWISKVS